jgi:hypothetical protein
MSPQAENNNAPTIALAEASIQLSNRSIVEYASFPAEFKAQSIWCLWRYEERDGKQTKVPYQPSGSRASSTNRATWSSFADCLAVEANFDGLGVFADGSHTFIDLDKCIVGGEIEPWALAVLSRMNSYAELSPSKTGLHVFVLGAVSKASKINGCEAYSSSRFFTVTGKHVDSTPLVINAMSAEDLEELRDDIAQDQLRPKVNAPKAGQIVHRPLSEGEREAKLERVLSGDISEYGSDRSAAVFGALQFLARKHSGDGEAIREEFEESQLCEDWGHKWERLAEAEIENAVTAWQENGRPPWTPPADRPLEERLAEMNEKYCYVDETDIVVRLENMRMFDSSRFKDGGHLANLFHTTETKRWDPKTGALKPVVRKDKLAKLWLEWPQRRQVERIAYEPGKERFFDDCINRWRGMGVEPVAGDVEPWHQLLEKLIPEPTVRRWFEQWCAYPLQHMGTKLKSAVVMWSTMQGTGKTTAATSLARVYGMNAAAINEADLGKQFNEWALDKQFVTANEITGGDKRNSADFMKELIAGHEHLRINQKFLPEISIRNCINFLFTSNHPNSFYLEASDRRYCIIEVPGTAPDRQFFDDYWKWLDNGGPAFLYHHLLNLPLEGFHPHAEPPMTEAKEDMIDISKSDLDRWLEEKREAAPNAISTAKDLLLEYKILNPYTQVKEAGMQTALRRLGAIRKKVSVDGQKLPLWTMNPALKEAAPHIWAAKYAEPKPSEVDVGL